jgi:tetratricopeptide (TPR) repeat protein
LKKHNFAIINRFVPVALILMLILPAMVFSQVIRQEISDALSSGDTARAIDLIQADIKLDPSFASNYYLLGQIYTNQGKFGDAEQQYQFSYDKGSRFFDGLYALGLVQLKLGKIAEAQATMETGLKKTKGAMKASFHNGMSLVYMVKGDANSADRELRQAIVLDSNIAEYHVNLGNANMQLKVYSLAIGEYEKAIALDTTSIDLYFRLAEACLEMKDYQTAMDKLRIVLVRDSTHAEAWMKAGGIYFKAARSARNSEDAKQRYMETIGSYKRFMELTNSKPDSITGRAYYETAMSYLFLGGYPEAKQNFAAILAVPVEPKDIYFYYGRAFFGNKEYDSALVNFQKQIEWVKRQPESFQSGISDAEINRWMGEAYENLKDYAKVVEYYGKSLQSDSTQERLLYGMALAYTYLGNYHDAVVYYMKRIALGIDEKYWSVYYNAATSSLYMAEKAAQEKEKNPGNKPPADSSIVIAPDPLAGIDFAKLAAEYLEKVIQFKPDNIKATGMLASIYLYQLSDCPKGVQLYEKVLTAESDNCEALKSLGYANFAGVCPKNFSRAVDYLQRALSCNIKKGNSEGSDVNLLLWIGQAYEFRAADLRGSDKVESKKNYKSAFDWYNKVLKYEPGNAAAKDGVDRVKFEY